MTKAKGSKRRQSGCEKDGDERHASGLQAAQQTTSSSPPVSSIDINAYPHIIDRIIEHASPSTLAALLQCNKYIFQKAAPALYRTIRLTQRQFAGMIEAGNAPAKRGSSSGLLGRSFSPYLREAIQHTRSIHLLEYDPDGTLPSLPRGGFGDILPIVVYPGPRRVHRHQYYGPYCCLSLAGVGGLRSSQLLIRLTEGSAPPEPMRLTHLHLSTTSVTLIVPFSPQSSAIPSFFFDGTDFDQRCERTSEIIVLLPPPPGTASGWSEMFTANPRFPDKKCWGPLVPNIFVGYEYLAVDPNGQIALPSKVLQDTTCWENGVELVPFVTWLDAHVPGTVFTEEEEKELREADRVYRKMLKDEGKVF